MGLAEFGTYLEHQWQLPPWLQGKEVLSLKPKAQPGCWNTSGSLLPTAPCPASCKPHSPTGQVRKPGSQGQLGEKRSSWVFQQRNKLVKLGPRALLVLQNQRDTHLCHRLRGRVRKGHELVSYVWQTSPRNHGSELSSKQDRKILGHD